MIKQAWLESGCVYGYRKINRDLRDFRERCGINRGQKLMRNDGIKARACYRKPCQRSGEVHVVTPNTLAHQFNPSEPNQSWVTDITHIRTHEGWLYLGVVMDLCSRKIIVHSDQGSQYTSYEWQEFQK